MNDIDLNYMSLALDEARLASSQDEVPVGCVIISEHNEILAQSHNLKEQLNDVSAHAELLAIKEASNKLKSWRLNNCKVYVTLEPCPMCMSALQQSRISALYFGAYDKKGGALSLGLNLHRNEKLNHSFSIFGGINHYECSKLLSDFFKLKRDRHLSK